MTKTGLDVYGIGNAIMDLQVEISESDFTSLGLSKGSMALVDVETQGRLLARFSDHTVTKSSGGSAANTIIGLAQLGAKTGYGCLVGDDVFGVDYLSELKALGVLTHNAPVASATTGTSVIVITPDAERTMNTNLGVSSELGGQHIDEAVLSSSAWLYIEGYLFSSPPALEAIRRSVQIAKSAGVKIAVTCSDAFVVEFFGEPLREILAQTDLLFANLVEGQKLTGLEDEKQVFDALLKMVPNVALTLSEKGALVAYAGSSVRIDAFPAKSVDATGAGDMFAGGFLYGVTHGMQAAEAGKLACFLAGRVVSQLGARLQGDVRMIARDADVLPA